MRRGEAGICVHREGGKGGMMWKIFGWGGVDICALGDGELGELG